MKKFYISVLKLAQRELGDCFSAKKYEEWRKKNGNTPSVNQIINCFGTFNKAKQEAGLQVQRRKYSTREDLLNDLRKSVEHLGYVPTYKEYQKLNIKPSINTIAKFQLTLSQALILAGYKPKKFTYTKNYVLKRLKSYVQNNKIVSSSKYIKDTREFNLPSMAVLKKFFGSFQQAIEAAGGKTVSNILQYTKNDLVAYMKNYYDKYKDTPSIVEWNAYADKHNLPKDYIYINQFGSWNEALINAGLKPKNCERIRWSRAKIIQALQENFDNIPNSTTYSKMSAGNTMLPSASTVRRHFHTIANAFKQAGFK